MEQKINEAINKTLDEIETERNTINHKVLNPYIYAKLKLIQISSYLSNLVKSGEKGCDVCGGREKENKIH